MELKKEKRELLAVSRLPEVEVTGTKKYHTEAVVSKNF